MRHAADYAALFRPTSIYMVKLNTDSTVYAGLEDVAITLDKVPAP